MRAWLQDYLKEQSRLALAIPVQQIEEWVQILARARENDAQVFCCGNGGSAANSSHFATDLGKGASGIVPPGMNASPASFKKRFRVISLTDNVAWITALGNDTTYDDIFVQQLRNYAKPGDVLIGVTVSGNSPNIVNAAKWAKDNGIITMGLVGLNAKCKLAEVSDHIISIPGSHYGQVEDAQMHVLHMLCYAFIENKV